MSRTTQRALLLLACGFAIFAAPNLAAERKEPPVILDEIGVKNLRIELEESAKIDFEETVFALGAIEVLPGSRAIVSSRIAGRALEVLLMPDHAVKAGAPAVVIESRQPGDPPPRITVEAPIAGIVSAVHVAPGEPVNPDKPLAEIIDLSTVYAVARVPQHFAGRVQPGQLARIRVAAVPQQLFEAQIEHLGAEADATNGTIEAAFHIQNPELLLRPGMRAEFHIVVSKREGVPAVPIDAVQGEPGRRFVFVADYELKNAFVKAPVVVGAQNDRFAEITSGLLPGDEVVVRGAYALSFAGKGTVSLKEALDAAHGHPHAEDGSELTGDSAAQTGSGPGAHVHARQWMPLTVFFAATTAVLFVLLLLLIAVRSRRSA